MCQVHTEACFTFAGMFYASDWRRSFWYEALGYAGQGVKARFAAFSITAGGIWVIGVFLKEGFNSY